jgi:CheY-like chemotaxis protein
MTRRILVIDDDSHIREVAAIALEMVGGWEVISADSGRDAERLVESEHPDAVLLDVMMPEVDGPTAVARMRKNPRTQDVPVIFLTAKTLGADKRNWGELDLAGIIAKPFDPMTLAAQMSELLGWSE